MEHSPGVDASPAGRVTLRYWASAKAAAGVASDAVDVLGPIELDALLGAPPEQIALLDRARTGVITNADAGALNKLGRHDLVNAAREDGRINYELEN